MCCILCKNLEGAQSGYIWQDDRQHDYSYEEYLVDKDIIKWSSIAGPSPTLLLSGFAWLAWNKGRVTISIVLSVLIVLCFLLVLLGLALRMILFLI